MTAPPLLHPMLQRQLTRVGIGRCPSDSGQWNEFLQQINHAYEDFDRDLSLAGRALDVLSREMVAAHAASIAISEHRLTVDRALLHLVLDEVSAGLLVIDQDGIVHTANAAALRMFGPMNAVVGRPLHSLLFASTSTAGNSTLLSHDWHTTLQDKWHVSDVVLLPIGRPAFTASCSIVPIPQPTTPSESFTARRCALAIVTAQRSLCDTAPATAFNSSGAGTRLACPDHLVDARNLADANDATDPAELDLSQFVASATFAPST